MYLLIVWSLALPDHKKIFYRTPWYENSYLCMPTSLPLVFSPCLFAISVEVMFDDQCDITWYIPKTVDPITLFFTTSFNIERDSMDLIGGEDGKTFRFLVSEELVHMAIMYVYQRVH